MIQSRIFNSINIFLIFTEFFQASLSTYHNFKHVWYVNKLIKNPSEKLKSQLLMNLMFAFEKPSSITRCSIRVMLIEHAERPGILWFARKNNRPSRSLWRHYPVRLESIFSTCCGNDCAAALTGVPSLFAGRQYNVERRHQTKIIASAPEPYSVNDWQLHIHA